MATAVIRILIEPRGHLSDDAFDDGVAFLSALGLETVVGDPPSVRTGRREVELIVDDHGREPDTDAYLAHCRTAFGGEAELGVITYISRGTEEDAHGILTRFGLTGTVTRSIEADQEVFVISLSEPMRRRVPESRLHTALEAALNAEVRIVAENGPDPLPQD